MRILQLTKKFPFPPKDGESLAITSLAKAYKTLGHETTLLSMNTTKHWSDIENLPPSFNHYTSIHTVAIDNRLRPTEAIKYFFSKKSYHIERFIDDSFSKKLIEVLSSTDFDVVQLETLYLAPYVSIIRKYSKALVAMRAHNVEHEIWERIASNDVFFLKKQYLQRITPRLKDFEVARLNDYDVMVGISERDVQAFKDLGLKKPAISIPIGLDCSEYKTNRESFKKPMSVSFIGSLDWMPNIEGLQWFLNKVWQPKLSNLFPDVELHIAGRNTPTWLKNSSYKNVKIHGEVECAKTFISQHPIMIAPLLSGSGMRAKILEAMVLGKVAISTRVGLEGIDASHKKEVLFADKLEDYISALHWCMEQGEDLELIGRNARNFAVEHFDTMEIGKKLILCYSKLLAQASGVQVAEVKA